MEQKYKIEHENMILDVVITQEKIEDKTFFVAQGIQIDVASQGLSLEEAIDNIKDAAEIVIASSKELKNKIIESRNEKAPIITRVFV
ncbi:MAG: hypothetical protein AABX03_03525 [Nanoarchaeota archaeon]